MITIFVFLSAKIFLEGHQAHLLMSLLVRVKSVTLTLLIDSAMVTISDSRRVVPESATPSYSRRFLVTAGLSSTGASPSTRSVELVVVGSAGLGVSTEWLCPGRPLISRLRFSLKISNSLKVKLNVWKFWYKTVCYLKTRLFSAFMFGSTLCQNFNK